MISQMKLHHDEIEQVLTDFPAKGEQWQMWSDYHQRQVGYWQNNRLVYVIAAGVNFLALVMSLVVAIESGNEWLWWLTLVLAATWLGLIYYLGLYTMMLHQLEAQTLQLYEKTLSITTKPGLTMVKYLVDIAGELMGKAVKKFKEVRDLDVWD